MRIKDQAAWERYLKNNDFGDINTYGGAVLWFAKRWAECMENGIDHGRLVADIAADCSTEVTTMMGDLGITGFQYGAAVATLSACWEHGEELRTWHNLTTQIGTEGAEANKRPGHVLNPAIIGIGPKHIDDTNGA